MSGVPPCVKWFLDQTHSKKIPGVGWAAGGPPGRNFVSHDSRGRWALLLVNPLLARKGEQRGAERCAMRGNVAFPLIPSPSLGFHLGRAPLDLHGVAEVPPRAD